MNELLLSLAASLQALVLLMSAQGMVPPPQLSSTLNSLENTLKTSSPIAEKAMSAKGNVSFDVVNKQTIPAIVNILCTTRSGGMLNPISGSGVIIDKRGIILTNAHVAQYVLLQNYYGPNSIKCVIRTGAPARARYTAEVLFMPEAWVRKHAKSIRKEISLGTGEDDYALLAITGRVSGKPLDEVEFPTVPFNLQVAITKPGSSILLAGYPAGFLGGAIIQNNLWPVSTVGQIQKLMTFKTGSVDVYDLGGSIVAQQGSSGGAVVDNIGNLIGIITTSSQAKTTDKRDLRAITLSHINASLQAYTSVGLKEFIQRKISTSLEEFKMKRSPQLIEMYKKVLN